MGALTMPTYDTPTAIAATVDVVGGDIRIVASARTDTTVDVTPSDPSNPEDVRAAEQTRVEYANGRLNIKTPKLRSWMPGNTGGATDVTIELPAGSEIHATAALADITAEGELGHARIKTGLGKIRVEHATTANLQTGLGDITLDRATGHVDVKAGSGQVRIGALDFTGVVKNSNGDTWIGTATGHLRVSAANGDIAIDRSEASVGAKSSNGDVRLGAVSHGTAVLESKLGDVEIGIPEGRAAYLDVRSGAGRVHNDLESAEQPGDATETVEVRARTTAGDVLVRRS
jgi:DUF4097 and DUF4098 domain-containing protein YvlB